MTALCALLVIAAAAALRSAVRSTRGTRARVHLGLGSGRALRAGRGRTRWVAAGVVAGAGLALIMGGWLAGGGRVVALLLPVAAVAIGLIRLVMGGRAERRLVEGLPDALDAMARAAAAGVSSVEAVRQGAAAATGELAGDLAGVVTGVDGGATLAGALEEWARRRDRPEVDLVASGLAMAIVTGGSVSWAAHHLADVVRANLDSRAAIVVQAAQARASAVVIGATPVAVVAVSATVDPAAASVLFDTPLGQACLVAGLLLAGLAIWWMSAIIRSTEAAVA
jgi:tight adherence protein B